MKIRTIEDARALRVKMETLSTRISDEEASNYVEFFPNWSQKKTYSLNDRVQFEDKVYKYTSSISGITESPKESDSWILL